MNQKSERMEKYPTAVAEWLREGELEAREINCEPYDMERFKAVLNELRALTGETLEVLQPRLVERCVTAGVAVVFRPELPDSPVYGASSWTDGKAVIQISARCASNDRLWFTFFCCAGHIILHARDEVFTVPGDVGAGAHTEAATFAEDILIPPAEYGEFIATRDETPEEITAFSSEVGIAPGIVVGCLQHDELLERDERNALKLYYTWPAA